MVTSQKAPVLLFEEVCYHNQITSVNTACMNRMNCIVLMITRSLCLYMYPVIQCVCVDCRRRKLMVNDLLEHTDDSKPDLSTEIKRCLYIGVGSMGAPGAPGAGVPPCLKLHVPSL